MSDSDSAREQYISQDEAIKSLYRSLFIRTLRDIVTYRGSRKRAYKKIYKEAYDWVFVEQISDCDTIEDKFMSFESVCDILNLDCNSVKERIPYMTSQDLKDLGHDSNGPNL
ncbi:MAG: hypothetical protein ACXAEU_19845 [Candidatus Hodarchaeales archaeon]|jgi:hypothetical protein